MGMGYVTFQMVRNIWVHGSMGSNKVRESNYFQMAHKLSQISKTGIDKDRDQLFIKIKKN